MAALNKEAIIHHHRAQKWQQNHHHIAVFNHPYLEVFPSVLDNTKLDIYRKRHIQRIAIGGRAIQSEYWPR